MTQSKAAVGTINYDKGTDAPEAVMPETMPVEDQQIVEETEEPYTFVEQMPDFPGGEAALREYLMKNVTYPQLAKESDVEGTVYVTFIVDKNGNISDIKVLRGIGAGCDEEAVRVISKMPRWNPGKQNGRPVPVRFNMPIKFQLI
ncbi:MAG: energy transducer TonB [Lentimicrobiaceae bacterium]|nr:energy transducer TonB [Lentimicrobiaceae bacterium]